MALANALILEFCDQAVSIIETNTAALDGSGLDSPKIERMFLPVNVDEKTGIETPIDEVEKLDGGRVYVYPIAFGQKDIASRGADLMFYRIGVQIYEVFDRTRRTAGIPQKAWCDECVSYAIKVYDWLSNPRLTTGTVFTGSIAGAWPDEAAVDQVFDPDMLRNMKVFWSVLSFTYAFEVAG